MVKKILDFGPCPEYHVILDYWRNIINSSSTDNDTVDYWNSEAVRVAHIIRPDALTCAGTTTAYLRAKQPPCLPAQVGKNNKLSNNNMLSG